MHRQLRKIPNGKFVANDFAMLGFGEIVSLGRNNNRRAKAPRKAHVHENAFELFYLLRGRDRITMKNRGFLLHGGDIFITPPDTPHGSEHYPIEKAVFYWFVLSVPKDNQSFMGLPVSETKELIDALRALDCYHYTIGTHFHTILDDILLAYINESLPLRSTVIRVKTLQFVMEIVGNAYKKRKCISSDVLEVMEYIDNCYAEAITVESLAHIANLSPSRLRYKFKEQVGIPPNEYVLRKKIEKAKGMIVQGGKSITEISYDLSFSSSQYFSTVFKQYTGEKPGDFKKEM